MQIRSLHILFFIILTITGFQLKAQSAFITGSDLSYANMMEDCGAEFREDGAVKDVFEIFADNGTNLVRVRLWHNPDWQEDLKQPAGVKAQYNNFEDARETIFRSKMAGMKVMLGFHFSDFWCDPGRQIVPKAWEAVANNTEVLADSVYNYVFKTLTTLAAEDLMPEYVKIGNENNSGIMTHAGMNSDYSGKTPLSTSWSRHAKLYNSAIKAVRDVSKQTDIQAKIALHVADPAKAPWFYNNIISNGVSDFDIMGFTYYYSYHGQTPSEVGQSIKTLRSQHPGYEAMVVETGYLWDTQNIDQLGNIIGKSSPSYQPVSPATQQKFMVDLSKAVKENGGSGVIFWEPAWVSTPCRTPWGLGSSQEHVAFFDHRNQLSFMKNGGGGWPDAFRSGSTNSKVKVTFNVDMSEQDVSRGVYIVGQVSNWEFVAMQHKGNHVYSVSFELLPGEVFAYYFITNNSWDAYESYRETVPEACANSDELLNDPDWTTDRAFKVPQSDTIISYVWASCETFTSSRSSLLNESGWKIYPNPNSDGKLFINHPPWANDLTMIEMIRTDGTTRTIEILQSNTQQTIISTKSLQQGLYLLCFRAKQQLYTQKVLIQ
ncbi:glycosyl hydrolase 53 family protein [Roseimarinus sediminis]|uniref:glycosyl hydrolase 53 family protein n=1 Tax=Roseimarinus sediminis TaxID=1610899 RepID=UPI003D1DF911